MPEKLKILRDDPWLAPHGDIIQLRYEGYQYKLKMLRGKGTLADFASGHLYYGMHRTASGWVFREKAPNASQIFLVGEFSNWKEEETYRLKRIDRADWELQLPEEAIKHGQLYHISMYWDGGKGTRLPSYVNRCVQDNNSKVYNAQVWSPPGPYQWKHNTFKYNGARPLIYEAHIGMATEQETVGTYTEFRERILPRIKKAGYNTIQLMAVQEHPYYGSFGYHVSNFFAVSSRFGTPYELKELVDAAHGMGIGVIMDLVHSHSVKNEVEGLARFDGSPNLYFHGDNRREHVAWDSLCFDYGKDDVLHFLLSNCRYWLEEYQFDGFRFDGVTSMLYYDHGLDRDFTEYKYYFDGGQDGDAIIYLTLANQLIHDVKPTAISIAEEMSGMPGLAEPVEWGGYGFNFRLAMGTPDYWIKIIKEKADDQWDLSEMFHELTTRRPNEQIVSYCESHDQALVGDKTIVFRLLDKEMYYHMNKDSQNLVIERGLALHKMIRLLTFSTAGHGYLNFMGNEFGHPEWIDFPREGNGWSYKYARRQWSLLDNEQLRYHYLADFDKDMIALQQQYNLLSHPWCNKIADNFNDKILAFTRGDLLFVFNLNPNNSFTHYGLRAPSGKYQIVLTTDDKAYGGFGNIDASVVHYCRRVGGVSGENWLHLYLPSRVGIVLKRVPTPSVHEL